MENLSSINKSKIRLINELISELLEKDIDLECCDNLDLALSIVTIIYAVSKYKDEYKPIETVEIGEYDISLTLTDIALKAENTEEEILVVLDNTDK